MTTLKERLIAEVLAEAASRINTVCANEQRLIDCEAVCRDLNDAAKELGIEFVAQPLVTVHESQCSVAAYSTSPVTIQEASDILEAASHLFRIEPVNVYGGNGQAIAFGIEGFRDQFVLAMPKHIVLTAQAAYDALDGEQLKAA